MPDTALDPYEVGLSFERAKKRRVPKVSGKTMRFHCTWRSGMVAFDDRDWRFYPYSRFQPEETNESVEGLGIWAVTHSGRHLQVDARDAGESLLSCGHVTPGDWEALAGLRRSAWAERQPPLPGFGGTEITSWEFVSTPERAFPSQMPGGETAKSAPRAASSSIGGQRTAVADDELFSTMRVGGLTGLIIIFLSIPLLLLSVAVGLSGMFAGMSVFALANYTAHRQGEKGWILGPAFASRAFVGSGFLTLVALVAAIGGVD